MLTNSQTKALKEIKDFIESPTQNVHCLSGSPGTGKSYLVSNAIQKLVRDSRYFLEVTATTNKASSVIGGKTLCKLFGITLTADLASGEQIYSTKKIKDIHNSFIIIDECSMLEKELWSIVNQHSHRCKFLLVGDKYQLPAVSSRMDVFSMYPVSELTEIVRQSDPTFLQQIAKAKEGVLNNTMYFPENVGPIHILTRKDHKFIKDLLKGFTTRDKALAYTNARSVELAENIRNLQKKPSDFCVGDPVSPKNYCETNNRNSLYPGKELVISHIGYPNTFKLTLPSNHTDSEGNVVNYELEVMQVAFEDEPDTYLLPIHRDHWLLLQKDCIAHRDWKNYYFLKEKLVDLRFNEASTVHFAQGSTYDRVFIDIADINKCTAHSTKARLMYVALSRAKNEVYIYDSTKE